jgi:hypothetical protein
MTRASNGPSVFPFRRREARRPLEADGLEVLEQLVNDG